MSNKASDFYQISQQILMLWYDEDVPTNFDICMFTNNVHSSFPDPMVYRERCCSYLPVSTRLESAGSSTAGADCSLSLYKIWNQTDG